MSSSNKKRKDRGAALEQELLRRVMADDFASVRHLIEIDRVSVNCTDENGKTPLMLAVVNNHFQIAEFLVQKLANMDVVDNEGCTALGYAMRRNIIAMFRLLIESRRANVDQQFQVNGRACSPLGCAIIGSDNVDVVALLIQFRANTVETICFGETLPALHQACRYSSSTEIVGLLLDHQDGVDVNKQICWRGNNRLMTPLCFACRRNNMGIVQLLVEREAQVIYHFGVGRHAPRPLEWAVIGGAMELIRFLLSKLPENMDNNSPALSEPLKFALRLNKLEAAQLLLDHGANVNGEPYLCMCAAILDGEEGVEERVSFLLENGANVNMADFGRTPLFAAAEHGNVEVVKMLLKARADVNIRTDWGETPLGVAHSQGHVDVVYLLLRTSPHVWPRLANFV